MSASLGTAGIDIAAPPEKRSRSPRKQTLYPFWFYIPGGVIYTVLFLVPTVMAFYFSLTRWNLTSSTFIGLDNFKQFFNEPALIIGLRNTLIYAFVTSAAKVVLGMLLALLLTSKIIGRGYLRSVSFFPVLVSTIGIGITFVILMNPTKGLINNTLAFFGIDGPGWLTNPNLALLSVAGVDSANSYQIFRKLIVPLSWPATSTVITLSPIGGLRSFDLIWAMTKGGPGFSSDVIASVIYKQYQAGFYGLSTAGNVVLFIVVTAVMIPISMFINKRSVDA